jgi:peroxiredoxin
VNTTTSPTDQPIAARTLEVGDIAPPFRLATADGEKIDPGADHISGKVLVLLFMPSGGTPPTGLTALAEQARGMGGRSFLIAAEPKDAPAGFAPLADPDDQVAVRYGTHGAPTIVVIAPNQHVAAIGLEAGVAAAALERIAARRRDSANHPPILIAPDVLSRADCQRLISVFATQGHTFLESGDGEPPPGIGDHKMRIHDYGRKDRIDHRIMSRETNAFIDARLKRRLLPAIHKCFQYKITKREIFRIGCYEGERGGQPIGHRDNTRANVAYRRFACSINLNTEQFEGGGLRFLEYGDHEYRPETGAAIVFSSSVLHEAMHVTSGKRYVLLVNLYGET